jgi:hypothetical protein
MLTIENGMYFFGGFLFISVVGYYWGVIELATAITLDEVFKETT